MQNTTVVLVGDAQGHVQCIDPVDGRRLKQYVNPTPPATPAVEQIAVGEAAGRLVVAIVVKKQEKQARVSIWDALAETLLRTTKLDDSGYGVVRAVQLSGGVQFLAAQTDNNQGRLQLFDPLLTPFRPPELYFISSVNNLTDPIQLEICYKNGNETTSKIMEFKPYMIMTDRNDKMVEYQSLLSSILTQQRVMKNGTNTVYIHTLKPAKDIPPKGVNLRWERAGSIRIAWRSTEPLDSSDLDTILEAVLHGDSGNKQVKSVPYSAVAPKIAAVALMDDTIEEKQRELWQKTVFFGDAATTSGVGTLRMGDSQFVYEAIDQEMFDLPVPQRTGTSKINLMLIKYLVNGQVIGTGGEVSEQGFVE